MGDMNVAGIPADVLDGLLDGNGQAKTERFELRLSEGQMAALRYFADMYNITAGEFLRRRISDPEFFMRAMKKRDYEAVADFAQWRMAVNDLIAQVGELRREVARVGNNANQIARIANEKRTVSNAEALMMDSNVRGLKRQTEDLVGACKSLLGTGGSPIDVGDR